MPTSAIMKAYSLDETFSWFMPGAGGGHDLKFGAQYQLGEHYREDQRVTNGRFIFPSDRAFNAADPATYPGAVERARAGDGASCCARRIRSAFFMQDKWQLNRNFTLSLGPPLRPPRVADHGTTGIRSSTTPNEYPVDKNNIQPRVGFAYSMADRAAVIRGGYRHVLRKAVDRPLRELPAEPRRSPAPSSRSSRSAQVDPGPSRRPVPDRPAPGRTVPC